MTGIRLAPQATLTPWHAVLIIVRTLVLALTKNKAGLDQCREEELIRQFVELLKQVRIPTEPAGKLATVLRESPTDKEKFVRTSMMRLQQQQMLLRSNSMVFTRTVSAMRTRSEEITRGDPNSSVVRRQPAINGVRCSDGASATLRRICRPPSHRFHYGGEMFASPILRA